MQSEDESLRLPCCFVRLHARLGTMLSFHNVAWFKHFTDLNLFKYAFNVIQIWEMGALQLFLFDGAYFLLAVMVVGDKSSRLKMVLWKA